MTRPKKKQIHYRDIIEAYGYGEVDNYNEARIMLWEKLPYMIGKICNKYSLGLTTDSHSHIYEKLDNYLAKGGTNIDSSIRNYISDYWLKDQIIDCTHYSIATNKVPISISTDLLEPTIDHDRDVDVEYYSNVQHIADEIKASLWILEDQERDMFISHYLRRPPMTFNELSEIYNVERHNVSNIIRTARVKIFNHLKHYEFN